MKRVLVFSLTYLPHVGGAELAIKEITDRLPQADYAFDLIALRFDETLSSVEKMGNVTVHRIGFTARDVKVSERGLPWQCRLAKALFPFSALAKALTLNREKPYDMVWAMMANQAGFAALFFKFLHPRVPYLLELQDGTPLSALRRRPLLRLIWPLYRAIYVRANAVKAISHFIKDLARDIGYTGRVDVIPNGVDVKRFSSPPPEDEIPELKAKLGKRLGDVFLFTASRLVLSRGVEDIINALPHVPTNVKLLIAGEGHERHMLEGVAQKAGVADRVVFLGAVAHADIPKYLHVSDIFVRPSLIEGMGSAFVEAFAAGIPVVATPVGGIPDFLTDPSRDPDMEPTGLFCNVRDPESIARAVRRYMEDPVLAARIVKNAKALASEKYDWDIIARASAEKIFGNLI